MSSSWVSAEEIIVGERLRQDFGDIEALARSIDEHGLLHPIVIDADNNLIAGERRLRAMVSLGWRDIEVRRFEELSASERRVLELEENLLRKDLTPYERSRKLVEIAEAAAVVDREEGEFRIENIRNPKGGRPSEPGSMSRVAARTGIPKPTIQKAQQHVSAAETYPVLQQPGWKQYQAMEAAELLNSLPEEERQPIAELIDQPAIHPRDAIDALRNVAQKPAPERKLIATLAQSEDSRDRTMALTQAAAKPPMPDDRIPLFRRAQGDLRKAIAMHPNDKEVPQIQAIITDLDALITAIKEDARNARTPTAA